MPQSARPGSHAARNALVESHLDLARQLAQRLVGRLPRSVSIEELEADAYLGLVQAAEQFDARRGVLFRTYAFRRIQGAMLDGLRERLPSRSGKVLTRIVSLDASCDAGEGRITRLAQTLPVPTPPVGQACELRDEAEHLMRRLDPALRKSVTDRHLRGLKQKDIAEKLGISASAMSQRMKKARRLMAEMQEN